MSTLLINLTQDVQFNTQRLEELTAFLDKQASLVQKGFQTTLPSEQLALLCGEQVMRRELLKILTARLEYVQSLMV